MGINWIEDQKGRRGESRWYADLAIHLNAIILVLISYVIEFLIRILRFPDEKTTTEGLQ